MVQGASEVDKPESTGRHKPDAHQGCVLFLEELRLYFTLSLEVELTIHDWILSKEMWANWIRPTSGPANQTPPPSLYFPQEAGNKGLRWENQAMEEIRFLSHCLDESHTSHAGVYEQKINFLLC